VILWLGVEFGVEAILAGWSAAYALATLPGVNAALVVVLYWAGLCAGRVCAPLALGAAASSSPSVSPRA
jgi:hypothetical protein